MPTVDPAAVIAGIEPLDLESAGDLVESCVLVVKVSRDDGQGELQVAATPGLSHWEQIGMLHEALHLSRGIPGD